MVAVPVTPSVMPVAIDIALMLFAPMALVTMVALAIITIVVLAVPLMLLVVPVLVPTLTPAVIISHHRSRHHQECRYQASDQQSLHDDSPVLFRDRSRIRTQCRMPLNPDYRTGRECQCPEAGFAGSLRNARSA